jgi:hypothetical protein
MIMTTDTFAEFVDQERARIDAERESLLNDKSTVDARLHQLDREMHAVDAYVAAKTGKVLTAARHRARLNGFQQPRPGSRRSTIIATISQHPQGLRRGELLEILGVKGDKSGEMAVSNALTALIKTAALMRNDENKYVVAA